MKKGKKALVIVIVVIIVVGSIIALTYGGRVFRTKDESKDTDTKEDIKNEEANITPPEKVPAANT